jgi:hypothetical protein
MILMTDNVSDLAATFGGEKTPSLHVFSFCHFAFSGPELQPAAPVVGEGRGTFWLIAAGGRMLCRAEN